MDGDGYPEFGGRGLNEVHPSEDSMYYLPVHYYEIRNGSISYDSIFSRDRDIWINGIYLAHPLDGNGNCCKVILKPGKKHIDNVSLIHPEIVSERIDGPANIRDTVRGRVLFNLYDNVPVYASDTSGKWCAVAVPVSLGATQANKGLIDNGRHLYWKDREIGITLADVSIDPMDIIEEHENYTGYLRGYTSTQNINPQTIPENILCSLIGKDTSLTISRLQSFIKGFQFISSNVENYKTFQLDELSDGPSTGLRIMLVFDHDKLFAVVHHRRLGLLSIKPSLLERGYKLTIVGDQPASLVSDFTTRVNSFISHAD
jgi:hypothetical protein